MSTQLKNLLKEIAAGKQPIKALAGEACWPDHLFVEPSLCSIVELTEMIRITKDCDADYGKFSDDDKKFWRSLQEDVKFRNERTFDSKIQFYYRREPATLYIISYTNPSRKTRYQISVGYDREAHPNIIYTLPKTFEYFTHTNLDAWEPEVDFSKCKEDNLPMIADILHKDINNLQRSTSDQQFIDSLKTISNQLN